jgi:hypothetical protein
VTPSYISELAAIGRREGRVEGLALVPDDWAKWALPTASSPYDQSTKGRINTILAGRGEQGWLDFDAFDPALTQSVRFIVETRIGGLSIPPPPFRLVMQTGNLLLYERPAEPRPAATRTPLEPPGTIGGAKLAAGQTFRLPLTGDVRLGAEPLDSAFYALRTWKLGDSAWVPWSADPNYIVSVQHGNGPARHEFELGAAGRYTIVLNGQTSGDMAVGVDGKKLPPPPPGTLGTLQPAGTVSLSAGRHELELFAGPASFSYLKAAAIEREGVVSLRGALCVGGRRYEARADRPLRLRVTPAARTVTNCGTGALRLDWIEPA